MGDYEEVPGDCRHFPGFDGAKANCFFCQPKPVTPAKVGRSIFGRAVDAKPVAAKPAESFAEFVHVECASSSDFTMTARYNSRCPECHKFIEEGDTIAPPD